MLNITQKHSPNFIKGRSGRTPEIIVLHISTGSLASMDSWFSDIKSAVSSHYGIGFNGEIHQYVQDLDTAWTQGRVKNPTFKLYKPNVNPNLYCISIEHEGKDLAKAPEAQLNASVSLIRTITAKYGIPRDSDHIIFHNEIFSDKPNCPTSDRSFKEVFLKLINKDDFNDPIVNVRVPKSKLNKITKFLLSI